MTAAHHDQVGWGVVVPVKALAVAKSRLAVLGEDARRALALAFAEDVVRAALGCPLVGRLLVVTDDAEAAAALLALGAEVVPDAPRAGLNAALVHGAGLLGRRGVAALSADLPALRPGDLAGALAATRTRAVVADADGTGTTLLAAAAGMALQPAFGARSAAAHRRSGAVELAGAAGLRRDVDTPDDLRVALHLGVGPSTRAVADAVLSAEVGCSPPAGTMHP